jgi:hypothetical protein
MKLEFSEKNFRKYSKIKFHENCPVGAKLFHVDRWTHRDVMKLIFAFCNFVSGAKNVSLLRLESLLC